MRVQHSFPPPDPASLEPQTGQKSARRLALQRQLVIPLHRVPSRLVEAVFGKAQPYGRDKVTPWGRLITYPEKGRKKDVDTLDVPEVQEKRRFTVDEDAGLPQLLYGFRKGLEGTPLSLASRGCCPQRRRLLTLLFLCCVHRRVFDFGF